MADTVLIGSGVIKDTDFKDVKWTGKTKSGKAIMIELFNAINLGDIDWAFKEKDETVPAVTFTATYSDANYSAPSSSTTEPWKLTIADGQQEGSDEIILGAGVMSIGGTAVALTRGGGSFKVVRDIRRISADGDRGPVKGRITCNGAEATLTLNALTFITRVKDLYPAVVDYVAPEPPEPGQEPPESGQ